MKILITSAGQLGTLLYHALKEAHDVRVMRRRPDETFGAHCVIGDVSRYDDVANAMDGRDVVFHTAVRNNTDVDLESYEQFHASNVDGTFNVFLCAHRLGVPRIVHSSTSMVSGFYTLGEKLAPGSGRATRIDDDAPRNGADVYSLTKGVGELYADYFRQRYDVSIISLRYGWLAPPAMYADPMMVYRTLQFCFHEQDALASNLLVMEQDTTGNYLICAPPELEGANVDGLWQSPGSVLETRFPDEMQYLHSTGFTPTPIPAWLDCSRAMRDLGYRPRHDFRWFVAAHRDGAFTDTVTHT